VHCAFYIFYIIQRYFVHFVQLRPSNYIPAINVFILHCIRIDIVYFSRFPGLRRILEAPCTVRSIFFILFNVTLYILYSYILVIVSLRSTYLYRIVFVLI